MIYIFIAFLIFQFLKYVSDTIVCFLRLVTAATLKLNRDMYEAFVLDTFPSLDDFISSQVEPMSVESDQIHIAAMANAFGLTIKVADLDGSETELNYHEIEPMQPLHVDENYIIHLLYRPGHYDILYK